MKNLDLSSFISHLHCLYIFDFVGKLEFEGFEIGNEGQVRKSLWENVWQQLKKRSCGFWWPKVVKVGDADVCPNES